MKTVFTVGASKYSQGGSVKFGCYNTGEIAMRVIADDGDMESTPTVNVSPSGAPPADDRHVWLKGWSENEGLPEALEQAGICRRTGDVFALPNVIAELALLSDEVIEYLESRT